MERDSVIEIVPQTFPPLKCVVTTKSNGVEFEKDFIKVLVDNEIGRTLSNAMFSVSGRIT